MKFWILVFALIAMCQTVEFAQGSLPFGQVTKVTTGKENGFYWDYYVYIPRSLADVSGVEKSYFLVVPNNTGKADDDVKVHDDYARKDVGSFIKYAETLNIIVLEPVFPRPRNGKQSKIYTQALARNDLLTKNKALARLDLQLIAMIDDARQRLMRQNLQTQEKFLMWGFSASAMFVNRFCLIHPTLVQAASIGAPGGWPILPVEKWQNQKLRYPIGIDDFKKVVNADFDREAFKRLNLYVFIGERDTNDSVIYRDGYDKKDEKLIFRNFGSDVVARLRIAEKVYKDAGCSGCQFVIYKNIGHETNREVANDIRAFYKKAMQQ